MVLSRLCISSCTNIAETCLQSGHEWFGFCTEKWVLEMLETCSWNMCKSLFYWREELKGSHKIRERYKISMHLGFVILGFSKDQNSDLYDFLASKKFTLSANHSNGELCRKNIIEDSFLKELRHTFSWIIRRKMWILYHSFNLIIWSGFWKFAVLFLVIEKHVFFTSL